MSRRTILELKAEATVWPTLEEWAKETRFDLKRSTENTRLYQKGHGILVAPMMLEVKSTDGILHVEAWIKANFFVRLSSLFILPAEMGIESGGIRAVLPRRIARTDVNKLLKTIHHPLIP